VIAWTNVGIVGMANSLPMQVGVARVLFEMGRDRQLPHVLSRGHAKHGTPWVSVLVASAISKGVALAMQDRIDDLTDIVNFGAVSACLMLTFPSSSSSAFASVQDDGSCAGRRRSSGRVSCG